MRTTALLATAAVMTVTASMSLALVMVGSHGSWPKKLAKGVGAAA